MRHKTSATSFIPGVELSLIIVESNVSLKERRSQIEDGKDLSVPMFHLERVVPK